MLFAIGLVSLFLRGRNLDLPHADGFRRCALPQRRYSSPGTSILVMERRRYVRHPGRLFFSGSKLFGRRLNGSLGKASLLAHLRRRLSSSSCPCTGLACSRTPTSTPAAASPPSQRCRAIRAFITVVASPSFSRRNFLFNFLWSLFRGRKNRERIPGARDDPRWRRVLSAARRRFLAPPTRLVYRGAYEIQRARRRRRFRPQHLSPLALSFEGSLARSPLSEGKK